MTKQFAIAARDHGEAVLDQVHGRVAFRRVLPVVAADGLDSEDHLGNLQLACAVTMSVNGLQHAPRAGQLLTGETRVGWNGAAMEGREKSRDRLHAIEALDTKRDHGHEWRAGRSVSGKRQVQTLPIAQIVQDVGTVFGWLIAYVSRLREGRPIRSDGRWRRCQYHRTGIFFRKPEHSRFGGFQSRGDKEIATPTVGQRVPSMVVNLSKRC